MGALNYPNKVKDVYRKLVYTNDGTNLLHDGANDTALSTITANITGQVSDLTNHFTGLSVGGSPSTNDVLKWDGSKWTTGSIGLSTTISDLNDVTISTVANNQLLQYDSSSSKWVNIDPGTLGYQSTLTFNAPSSNNSNPSTSAQILTALNLKLNIADIDDTAVDGETNQPISSNWAFDHNAGTGNSKHVPAAGTSGHFLAHNGVFAQVAYSNISGTPTIPSGNAIIDWTADQGGTNIHAGNYTDTNTNQLTEFTLTGDSGSNQTIAHGNTLDIAG